MKKIITTVILSIILSLGINTVFADTNSGYNENFDGGALGEYSSIYYASTKDFLNGVGGKAQNDKSLLLEKTDTTVSNMYIQTYLTINNSKRYFKYELQLMPDNSDDFSCIYFATNGSRQASPKIYLNGAGEGDEYALKPNEWNKIIFVCRNGDFNTTSSTYSATVDMYVNGKTICTSKSYTFYKKEVGSESLPLRLLIYNENKAAQFSVKIDDIDINRYSSYPEVFSMPENRPELDIRFDKASARVDLRNAQMLLAAYDSNGVLKNICSAQNDGKLNLELEGSYASAKAFVFDSINGLKPVAEKQYKEKKPVVVACWGDSLTQGDGSSKYKFEMGAGENAYPAILERLTGYEVWNMGVAGETAIAIAARQGAADVRLNEGITIPAGCTAVDISFKAYYDNYSTDKGMLVVPRRNTSWNPCIIQGVEGTLTVGVEKAAGNSHYTIKSAKFTRKEAGEAVIVPAGTKIEMPENKKVAENADINIFFVGTNGITPNVKDDEFPDMLIELIDRMIAQTKDPSKYIIVGLAAYSDRNINFNTALKEAIEGKNNAVEGENNAIKGKKYVTGEKGIPNVVFPRDTMLDAEILKNDYDIVLSEQDKADIEAKKVPEVLRKNSGDYTHFNDKGYEIIADLIYKKMIELGYVD